MQKPRLRDELSRAFDSAETYTTNAAALRKRIGYGILGAIILGGVIALVAGCHSPTAPSDSANTCPKGRTDCSPYITPRDTIAHP